MENRLEILQGFLDELYQYCDRAAETERWYGERRGQLEQDQESRRAMNEENYRKQQSTFTQMQEKNASERTKLQTGIRNRIRQERALLEQSIRGNEALRDEALRAKDQIARPEYFQYAYRYREYGDFHPEITKLDDFRRLDLQKMVDQINRGSAGIWLNKLKALFKSEDMMIEYASFANLLGKARYLCEVENDALKDKARLEISRMENELEKAEESFKTQGAELFQKQQTIQKENGELTQLFQAACKDEWRQLEEEYHDRQYGDYNRLRTQLQEHYTPELMEAVHSELEAVQKNDRKHICEDEMPLAVKLSKLWYDRKDLLKNDNVKQILESSYPFMICGGRLSIPGVV